MPKPKVVYSVSFLVTDKSDEPITKVDIRDTLKNDLYFSHEAVISKIQVVDNIG